MANAISDNNIPRNFFKFKQVLLRKKQYYGKKIII